MTPLAITTYRFSAAQRYAPTPHHQSTKQDYATWDAFTTLVTGLTCNECFKPVYKYGRKRLSDPLSTTAPCQKQQTHAEPWARAREEGGWGVSTHRHSLRDSDSRLLRKVAVGRILVHSINGPHAAVPAESSTSIHQYPGSPLANVVCGNGCARTASSARRPCKSTHLPITVYNWLPTSEK